MWRREGKGRLVDKGLFSCKTLEKCQCGRRFGKDGGVDEEEGASGGP